ncbi:uncharacterized protein LOC143148485 isoform X1 [Ptiloglossa arizonensis]|uniref:uncharacterized protein LOC143148485 isoform X1 n=1 Tax=Ptiloglossa arizonensis TaxID=3350558 RepID=UPI003FA0009A
MPRYAYRRVLRKFHGTHEQKFMPVATRFPILALVARPRGTRKRFSRGNGARKTRVGDIGYAGSHPAGTTSEKEKNGTPSESVAPLSHGIRTPKRTVFRVLASAGLSLPRRNQRGRSRRRRRTSGRGEKRRRRRTRRRRRRRVNPGKIPPAEEETTRGERERGEKRPKERTGPEVDHTHIERT